MTDLEKQMAEAREALRYYATEPSFDGYAQPNGAVAQDALAKFDAQAAEQAAWGGEAVAAVSSLTHDSVAATIVPLGRVRFTLTPGTKLYTHPDPAAPSDPQPKGAAVPQGPRTEFVLNKLRSALSAMTTFFGMDEDEASKPTLDKARQALDYAEIVMRPLEPWERQSLEDFRACVRRWHEKAVAKGYDGVESMCDTALPYGTRDLRLVSASTAPAESPAAPSDPQPKGTQECGHPESLALKSAETGEPLYCEACDDKAGRRDAEDRETAYAVEIGRLRNVIQAACIGGTDLMIERWKQWFPDAPVPTVQAPAPVQPVGELTAEQRDAQEAPFEAWWEKHGQFHRAGGGAYEKTFAWHAWCAALSTRPELSDAAAPTYSSTQATNCASCGEHKHTPLRIDAMGGYVCLTCIDKKLGGMLGEFGYEPDVEIDALRREAERYRCWRDAMLSADADFNQQIAAALPAAVGTERRPTAAEWDAAIDAALAAARGEKRRVSRLVAAWRADACAAISPTARAATRCHPAHRTLASAQAAAGANAAPALRMGLCGGARPCSLVLPCRQYT